MLSIKGLIGPRGEIYGWLNPDDQLEKGALGTVTNEFAKYPEADVFVGHGRKVDIAGKTVYYKEPGNLTFEGFCSWLEGGNFMQPSCFFSVIMPGSKRDH